MRIHKRVALGLSAALAVTGVVAVTSGTAQAYGPASSTINCKLYFSDSGTGGSPSTVTDSFTLTHAPASPAVGQTVTLTFTAAQGPTGGPAPVAANTMTARTQIQLSGAQSGVVNGDSGGVNWPATAYDPTNYGLGNPDRMGGFTTTGTYVAAGTGAISAAFLRLNLDDSANTADTYCSGSGTGDHKASPVVSTVIVDSYTQVGPEITINSATNPGADGNLGGGDDNALTFGTGGVPYVRSYDIVNVSGNAAWAPSNNNLKYRFCPASVTTAQAGSGATMTCSPLAVTVASMPVPHTVDAGGQLSTTNVKLHNLSGFAAGSYKLVLNQFAATPPPAVTADAINTATVAIVTIGARTLSGPGTVSPGGANALTGSNFYPGETVTVRALNGAANTADAAITTTASGTGGVNTSYTVNASPADRFNAAGIANAAQGTATGALPTGAHAPGVNNAQATFALSADSCTAYTGNLTGGPGCSTSQTINGVVTAGNLSQAAAITGINTSPTLIDMGSTQTSVTGSTLNGNLNTITVTDNRGGVYGWSLTASLGSDLLAGSYSIAKANLTGTPTCTVAAAGSATGVTTGGAQNFGGTVNLCTHDTVADSAGDTTGGQYTVVSPLALAVPAFQAAGSYSALMTITLA